MATLVFGIGLLYSKILNVPFREFLVYFGSGILAWTFISSCILEGCSTLMESESHIKALPIPTPLFAARIVYRNLIIFGHNLLAILLVIFCFGTLTVYAPLALFGVLLLALFAFGLALALAPLCLRFRDVPQVVQNLVQMLFFMTPIFWQAGHLGARHPFVEFNPVYHLIELVRAPLIGHPPTIANLSVGVGAALASLLIGFIAVHVSRRSIFLWL